MNVSVFVTIEIDEILVPNGSDWQEPTEDNRHVAFRNLEDRIRARLKGHMENILEQAEVQASKYNIRAGVVERKQ